MAERPGIDVYPVGVLHDLLILGRAIRHREHVQWALRRFRSTAGHLWHWACTGNWRAVKGSFNGYLAEPVAFPASLRRCGSGWTKRRALRSLARHMRRAEALRRHPAGKAANRG